MSDYSDVEKKLAIARTRLILDKPFLGALVLRLPVCDMGRQDRRPDVVLETKLIVRR
ncbi:MAG: hypothetical protein RQ982_10255 [Gammaproteobacteria bacterium]|nr:hypothetical protein [Gammaproteobacteria bacterium]